MPEDGIDADGYGFRGEIGVPQPRNRSGRARAGASHHVRELERDNLERAIRVPGDASVPISSSGCSAARAARAEKPPPYSMDARLTVICVTTGSVISIGGPPAP